MIISNTYLVCTLYSSPNLSISIFFNDKDSNIVYNNTGNWKYFKKIQIILHLYDEASSSINLNRIKYYNRLNFIFLDEVDITSLLAHMRPYWT